MELKEAIEGFEIDNALLSGRKGGEWQSVIDRNNLAIKALEALGNNVDNGYTLCKVNEAVERIRINPSGTAVREWIKPEEAIEIIKEACK